MMPREKLWSRVRNHVTYSLLEGPDICPKYAGIKLFEFAWKNIKQYGYASSPDIHMKSQMSDIFT